MRCRFCRKPPNKLSKIDDVFQNLLDLLCNQLVSSFKYFNLVLAQSSAQNMDDMSALEEALDILPFTVTCAQLMQKL